jgi:hypothetical protein
MLHFIDTQTLIGEWGNCQNEQIHNSKFIPKIRDKLCGGAIFVGVLHFLFFVLYFVSKSLQR